MLSAVPLCSKFELLCLQTLWYHCQKPLTSLHLVASLAGEAAAKKLRGAGLLNLLHQKSAAVTGLCSSTALMQFKPYIDTGEDNAGPGSD